MTPARFAPWIPALIALFLAPGPLLAAPPGLKPLPLRELRLEQAGTVLTAPEGWTWSRVEISEPETYLCQDASREKTFIVVASPARGLDRKWAREFCDAHFKSAAEDGWRVREVQVEPSAFPRSGAYRFAGHLEKDGDRLLSQGYLVPHRGILAFLYRGAETTAPAEFRQIVSSIRTIESASDGAAPERPSGHQLLVWAMFALLGLATVVGLGVNRLAGRRVMNGPKWGLVFQCVALLPLMLLAGAHGGAEAAGRVLGGSLFPMVFSLVLAGALGRGAPGATRPPALRPVVLVAKKV